MIDAKESSKGPKADVIYKAELTRSDDGTVRLYFYDKDMNSLDLAKLDKTAKAVLMFKKSKKWTKTPFTLTQKEGAFEGTAPKAASKPYFIDIHVMEGGKKLLTAFDNLD